MKSYVEVVTTPTADTPGTLLMLHFDNRRYLIGNVSEGTQRACVERGVGMRKVSSVLITGRMEWANIGGLLGLILELADIKREAKDSSHAALAGTVDTKGTAKKQTTQQGNAEEMTRLDIHGPPNLNHMIAASRRFIFRTGMPMNTVEHGANDVEDSARNSWQPTWEDDRIRVWAIPVLPAKTSGRSTSGSRKRGYDELQGGEPKQTSSSLRIHSVTDPDAEMRKAIVGQMFNSSWRLDTLLPLPISQVKLPAKLFVRDSQTRQLTPYTGPMPGGSEPVPDVTVWVREPWPGALTENLPPTKPAPEALSYIIRNHPQRGKFLPAKAKELGVPMGYLWSRLSNGFTVQNEAGEDVTPEMVLGPGKQGGGLAVIDLPSVDYVETLVSKPEWQAKEVMDGVEAMVWILGPGVSSDSRLRRFQEGMSSIKHVIASSDCCPNVIAFEAAAVTNLRHNMVDETIYPNLEYSPVDSRSETETAATPPFTTTAQRGQILNLEPTFSLDDSNAKFALDLTAARAKMAPEFQTLTTIPTTPTASRELLPHANVEIIVLGTGSSHPSLCRNVSGILIRVPGCGSYLLDCGEGTLGTLRRMFPAAELDAILGDLKMVWISHLHADHHLGLASLIKAWSRATDSGTAQPQLAVVSDAHMLHWLHEYGSAEDLGLARIIPIATSPSPTGSKVTPADQTTVLRLTPASWTVAPTTQPSASTLLAPLNLRLLNTVYVHHCRNAQAIALTTTSGFKFAYSGDCRPSSWFGHIGRDAHLLVHEATFEDGMRGEAVAKRHSTAGEAVVVGGEMGAGVVLLTHFSQRYPGITGVGVKEGEVAGEVSEDDEEAVGGLDDVEPVEEEHVERSAHPLHTPDLAATTFATVRNGKGGNGNTTLPLLSAAAISGLIKDKGMQVVFAFDYMRLKIGDVGKLVGKEQVLREVYEREIGKDVLGGNDAVAQGDGSGDDGGSGGGKKKQSKKQQQKEALERKQKQKDERKAKLEQKGGRKGDGKDGGNSGAKNGVKNEGRSRSRGKEVNGEKGMAERFAEP